MIVHKKGSLFEAPKESFLVHSCNCQGVWGSGVAAEFKKKFPQSFQEYRDYCVRNESAAAGDAFISTEDVVCLMTSPGFGDKVSGASVILHNTLKALNSFLKHYDILTEDKQLELHSNKFNSGLFRVPWEKTEIILRGVMDFNGLNHVKWTVWDNS